MGDAPTKLVMENRRVGGISTLRTRLLIIGGEGRISSPRRGRIFAFGGEFSCSGLLLGRSAPHPLPTRSPASTPPWHPSANRSSPSWYSPPARMRRPPRGLPATWWKRDLRPA